MNILMMKYSHNTCTVEGGTLSQCLYSSCTSHHTVHVLYIHTVYMHMCSLYMHMCVTVQHLFSMAQYSMLLLCAIYSAGTEE